MPVKLWRGWSSVQTRVTALMLGMASIAVFGLVMSRSNENRRIGAQLTDDAKEHTGLLDRALELEGSSLATFAKDYTNWGEMERFVETGDRTWARVNIDDVLTTYQANAAWVFDAAGSPVYEVRDSTLEPLLEPLPPGLSVKDEFGNGHFCHFFIAGRDGPIEIRGATIHPSEDDARLTPLRGYFLAARSWNRHYLAELAKVTGKKIWIEPASAGAKPTTDITEQSGEITFTRPLPGPHGRPELALVASLRPGWITASRLSGRSLFVQQLWLSILGILSLTLVLWFWVTRPLGRIRRSLESGSTEALKPLERSRTEFGQISELIVQFFGQNAALSKEVADRKQAEAELRESEQRYRETVDALPEAVFEAGQDGRLTLVNRSGLTAFGFGETDIARGVNVFQLLVPEDRERAAADARRVMNGESRPGTEYTALRKDGSRFAAIVHAGRILHDGQPVGLRGILIDISARKLTEKTLSESEERFRDLFNNMSSGVAVYETRDQGASFILRNLNRGGERIDSLHREEVVGRNVQQVFAGIEEFGLLAAMRRVWQTGKPERHPIGQYRDDRISGWRDNYVYKLPSGEIVAVYDDVTARVQAETALRESEQRFRDVALCSADWVWEVDAQGRYTFCSEHVKRVLGYEPGELLGRTPFDLMPEDERTRVGGIFAGIAAERAAITDLENRNITKDGREIVLLTNGVPMLDSDGNLLGYRGVDKDITDRKRTEAEIAGKNAELVELNNVKNQLLGMAAHDLRNPLSIVSAASSYLLDDASRHLPETRRNDFLRRINSGGEFMLKLIDDLLDVAKIEAGKLDLQPKEEDLCGLIEDTLTLNRMLAEKKRIRLDFTPEYGLPPLRFDRGKVEQVLNNLFSNAIKFSAPGTAVKVQASRVNGSVLVSVRDQGQGIPPEELDKLFKPFSKTSVQATAGESSTGLGLAICRKIIEGHGGRIWAESEVGKGSTFSFSLPTAEEQGSRTEAASGANSRSQASNPRKSQ
jgi:PAS domain S-box-containing protein